MATRRKVFKPTSRIRQARQLFAEFMAALLEGRVQADKLREVEDSRGRVARLDYDDPNG